MGADAEHSPERTVGLLGTFEKAIQTPRIIEPSKGAFHLPALPTVLFVRAILRGPSQGNGDMIFALGRKGNNAPGAKSAAQGGTVPPFVQPQTLGVPVALAETEAIKGCQDGTLIMPVRGRDGEVERMPMRFDDVSTQVSSYSFAAKTASLASFEIASMNLDSLCWFL